MTTSMALSRRSLLAGVAAVAVLAKMGWPALALAAPVKGGTVIMALDGDPETLNAAVSSNYGAGDVGAKLFEALVWLDEDALPKPQLATSWTISPDGLTYTFTLRDGVTFHDGKPLTSADVKFSFDEVLSKFHPRTSVMAKRLALQVEAPDPKTVVMKLSQPYAPFLTQLSVFDTPIVPKHLLEGQDILKSDFANKPVGSGPFRFVEWNRGANLTLEANKSYWDAGKPYLDRIVYQVMPQPASRIAALETGEVDFVSDYYLAKADVPRLIKSEKYQARIGKALPAIYFAQLNMRKPPFDNPKARQAVSFAVDRARLVQQAMNGLARPGYGAFGDGFKWTLNEDASYAKLYPYNPEQAKALLKEAGVAEGTRVRLAYEAPRPQMIATAQILRENLRAIGLDPVVEPLERTVLLQKVFKDNDFDMALGSYFSSGDPAIGYHRLYVTNATQASNTNGSGYSSPEVDDLLSKASTIADVGERGAIYKQVQAILSKDMPSVVLYDESGVDLATKKLHGLWESVDTRAQWADVWLEG